MSISAQQPGFVRRIAHLWRSRKITPAMQRWDCCGVENVERIGHELGVSVPELHTLAGKWPDAVEPLNYRLTALALDAAGQSSTRKKGD